MHDKRCDFWHMTPRDIARYADDMNGTPGERSNSPSAGNFLATVWPVSLRTDSEMQRRKKAALRSAQLAVAVMVAAGVVAAVVADIQALSPLQITVLIAAAVAYTGWSLNGMRRPIQILLAEHAPQVSAPAVNARTILYFTVQLALAGIVFTLSNQVHGGALAWLVLLPPVAHSVILLPRSGIVVVSILSTAVFAINIFLQQGPRVVFSASVSFSFAVFFTLIFTLLAVSAERSRGEVQKLADELAAANQKLREYAVEAEELAATRERNRMAREIHDSLGHYLTIVNVQIEAARAMHSRDVAKSRDALDKAQSLTQEGLKEIRRSVAALRALPLDNKSLTAALRQIVDECRAGGLDVVMEVVGSARELVAAAELTLYRAAQEGLTNVRKHAAATSAKVMLDFRGPASVRLTVSDNGTGALEGVEPITGFGILGLRERTHLLGGDLQTKSKSGEGFTLQVEVPG